MSEEGSKRTYDDILKSFALILPVKTIDAALESKTFEFVVVLRFIESPDEMTIKWMRLPFEFLEKLSRKIINEIKEIGRVVYDVSPAPPASVEWE